MLQNAYFLAKIGADTAENEQHFAEVLPTDALRRRRLGALAAVQRVLQNGVMNAEIWNNLGLCCFYAGQSSCAAWEGVDRG